MELAPAISQRLTLAGCPLSRFRSAPLARPGGIPRPFVSGRHLLNCFTVIAGPTPAQGGFDVVPPSLAADWIRNWPKSLIHFDATRNFRNATLGGQGIARPW